MFVMNKNTAGERKRTITITLGEYTESVFVSFLKKQNEMCPGMDIGPTAVAAACFVRGLKSYCDTHDLHFKDAWNASLE